MLNTFIHAEIIKQQNSSFQLREQSSGPPRHGYTDGGRNEEPGDEKPA